MSSPWFWLYLLSLLTRGEWLLNKAKCSPARSLSAVFKDYFLRTLRTVFPLEPRNKILFLSFLDDKFVFSGFFRSSTHCQREHEAAPCLFRSCRRRWRSCISTKTRAESQTERSYRQTFPPHEQKHPDTTTCLTQLCLTPVELMRFFFSRYQRIYTDSLMFQVWLWYVFIILFVSVSLVWFVV